MKNTTLDAFLNFLKQQDANHFKSDTVDRYLAQHRIDHEEFLPYTFFREDSYGRNLIEKNDFFELLVLTWLPGQRTPIHDHAGQRCWVLLELGSLVYKNYQPVGPIIAGKKYSLTPIGKAKTAAAGQDPVYIDDELALHSIANGSKKPAISVHLYAGPVPECHVYDEATQMFHLHQAQYFTFSGQTWTEPDPSQIKELN